MAQYYGLASRSTPLQAEFSFIKAKGFIEVGGKKYGMGLEHHYRAAISLMWPNFEWHRWATLGLKRISENEITIVMGPSDSNKTYLISAVVLTDWWAHCPDCLWMVSSTDLQGAELRVWGTIKLLFNKARERFDWLPGTVLESKHCITTDQISEDGSTARLLTKGIIVIPCKKGERWVGMGCFPALELVDTPTGKKPICDLNPGDYVSGILGPVKVKKCTSRFAKCLVRITLKDGRYIDCTPEHPILTEWGWKLAIDIRPKSRALLLNDPLRDLQHAIAAGQISNKVLFQDLPKEVLGKEVPGMREKIHSVRAAGNFLFQELQRKMEMESTTDCGKNDFKSGLRSNGTKSEGVDNVQSSGEKAKARFDEVHSSKDFEAEKTKRNGSVRRLRTESRNDSGRKSSLRSIPEGSLQLQNRNRKKREIGSLTIVSDGLGFFRRETGRGNRRQIPHSGTANIKGQKEDRIPDESRVVSVEVLRKEGDSRYNESEGGYLVYDLEVEGHPSYVVNGVVVHNSYVGVKPTDCGRMGHAGDEVAMMQLSFLDAYSNWYGKPNFKGLLTGNPTDIDDPLCKAAEPLGGWSNFDDTKKTQEWRSQWYDAWVVAYDGRDSPNFDFPELKSPKYPYLIGPKKIKAVLAAEKTEDSDLYRSQAIGKPTPGHEKKKVITWQICEQGKVFDDVVWEGEDRIHLGACDAAYSGIGGDRCVVMHGEYGRAVGGKTVLLVYPPAIVPVKISQLLNVDIPEVQIAKFCEAYFRAVSVPPENFFFDARATMAVEFGKHWSTSVNAIDFGGCATKRPASMDEFVWEGEVNTRRLLRCDEKYCKFVTELWFSVRSMMLSGQLKGVTKEVAEEGTRRHWNWTNGSPRRIEIETKEEMKKRTKQSPDYFDTIATLVEGARRLGFVIENLKFGPAALEQQNPDWFEKELRKHREFRNKHQLNYG